MCIHRAYIIIPIQRPHNCIIHLKATRQWPLAATRNCFAAVEHQSRCSDIQACCSCKHQPLGLSNPSQLDTARTILTVASVFYLKQPNTTFNLHITKHHLSLLVAMRLILATASALNIKSLQNRIYSLQWVLTSLRQVLTTSKKS